MIGYIVGGIVGLVVIGVVVMLLTKQKSTNPPDNAATLAPTHTGPKSLSSAKPVTTTVPGAVREHWLVGVTGDIAGKNFHIGSQTITIGRAANNFIQITDSDASRMHCRIVSIGGSLQVQDMDSSNGIYVNDKKVKRHILQDQDELRIGECRFVYHRSGEFAETTDSNKSVSTEILRPTTQYDGEIMTELIVKALQESNGDVVKVAEAVDLPVEKIKEIGKQHGVL